LKTNPPWQLEFDLDALADLKRLDKPIQSRIIKYLKKQISDLSAPTAIGKALKGNLRNLWRYRVADYRIICSIDHDGSTVLVLRIAHRRKVYK
jgi:mRNA interferase RelE/StbE